MNRDDESNYTVRPLTIDDIDQYNALLRYAFQVTEQELSETGWKNDEIKRSKFPVLQRADVLGCFNGNDLVSQFAVGNEHLQREVPGWIRDQRLHIPGAHWSRHYEAPYDTEPHPHA